MTVPTHQFEAKVRAVTRRTNKSGDWWSVTLEIQPHDFDEALCTMAQAQQRVQTVIAAIGDNEQPVEVKPARKPATTRAEKARRLCGVPAFQAWAFQQFGGDVNKWPVDERYQIVSDWLKKRCGVGSKSRLDQFEPEGRLFEALLSEYEQSTGRMAERH